MLNIKYTVCRQLLSAVCLQLNVKKRVVIGAILFIWIAVPAFVITFACLSTNIVNETCVPWFGYSSYAMEKTLSSFNIVITYLLPLMCMVACYSRIVYTLRNKVTSIMISCLNCYSAFLETERCWYAASARSGKKC